jgi:hypothetical protein
VGEGDVGSLGWFNESIHAPSPGLGALLQESLRRIRKNEIMKQLTEPS